jgi:Arc/MetJ-type ribon-helix-helix transcriptional regulator
VKSSINKDKGRKMKQKLSVTIDEKNVKLIEKLLEEGLFRSKSHIIEYSLNKFLKENTQGVESK